MIEKRCRRMVCSSSEECDAAAWLRDIFTRQHLTCTALPSLTVDNCTQPGLDPGQPGFLIFLVRSKHSNLMFALLLLIPFVLNHYWNIISCDLVEEKYMDPLWVGNFKQQMYSLLCCQSVSCKISFPQQPGSRTFVAKIFLLRVRASVSTLLTQKLSCGIYLLLLKQIDTNWYNAIWVSAEWSRVLPLWSPQPQLMCWCERILVICEMVNK